MDAIAKQSQNGILKMRQESAYADLIRTTSDLLVSQGFVRPTLESLYEAQMEPTRWEGIIADANSGSGRTPFAVAKLPTIRVSDGRPNSIRDSNAGVVGGTEEVAR